jgi:hypothetical protein
MSLLNRRSVLFAAATLLSAGWSSSARADEALEFARACAAHVDSLADRTSNAIIDDTLECLRRINELLEAGNEERARQVARECIAHVERLADAGTGAIADVCERCVWVLVNEYGAERLAHRFRQYCGATIEDIRHLERRAINAILSKFE